MASRKIALIRLNTRDDSQRQNPESSHEFNLIRYKYLSEQESPFTHKMTAEKLKFCYGTVSSAKSMNLLAIAHNYHSQGKQVICVKPAIDTRNGRDWIHSKCELRRKADVIIEEKSDGSAELDSLDLSKCHCILVDECQFLEPAVIDRLNTITKKKGVPVLAFGLRTDFRRHLFPASRRLMELADEFEEIRTICWTCKHKATCNLRLLNGVPTTEGASVHIGGLESFIPTCGRCYESHLEKKDRLF